MVRFGSGLNDNDWHTVHIRRRAGYIELWVDNDEHKAGKRKLFAYLLFLFICFVRFWSSESFAIYTHRYKHVYILLVLVVYFSSFKSDEKKRKH